MTGAPGRLAAPGSGAAMASAALTTRSEEHR
jgi:hypothetical protein